MASLYIHIPYCTSKCLYCDFYSCNPVSASFSQFVRALVAEISLRAKEVNGPLHTLYIGGGTPSLLPSAVLEKIVNAVNAAFSFVDEPEKTIEVNPDDVTPQLMNQLSSLGFNRVSAGIQSLNDSELRAVGRRHNARTALRAMELLRSSFSNVSFDVIFGLPEQTLESFRQTLSGVLAFKPDHLSGYSLMYEPGTPLTAMRDRGDLSEPSHELSEQMFELLTQMAADEGLIRYETSNYSRPGKQSRHNLSYWTGVPYLGLGPAAHSYDGHRIRRANPADLRQYIKHFIAAASPYPFYTQEILTYEELIEEFLLTRLRLAKGFPLQLFADRFGSQALLRLMTKARPQIQSGNLRLTSLTAPSSLHSLQSSQSPNPSLIPVASLSINPAQVLISDTILLSLL